MSNLKKVAKYFSPGAASPMEVELYIKLALLPKDGGMGVDALTLNKEIKLSPNAAKVAGQSFVIVDLFHADSKVVIEYDSQQFHSDKDQSQKDKRRRDALQADGYKCFSIVTKQIADREIFNAWAMPVVKAIKGRFRIKAKHFDYKQNQLFRVFWKSHQLSAKDELANEIDIFY